MLLLRRTFPELHENHVIPLQKLLKDIATYRVAEKVFVFPNGSRIKLGYCNAESDVLQFQGQSYDVIFMEEAGLFTPFQFQTLTECNRLSGNIKEQFNPRMYFTANPGGPMHSELKRLFVERNYRATENENDYTFIPAKVYDNAFIIDNDPDYVRALERLPEKRRKMMLDGDWNAIEGQYFEEFDTEFHVIKPRKIEQGWKKYVVFDYGLDMLACYFVALDFQNNAYVYKEIYESNLIVTEAIKKINSYTTEKIYMYIAPPDLWNRHSDTGRSTADIFAENGIYLTKANNDRINGWLQVKEWFAMITDEQGHKHPKLRIFENCNNLIRTIQLLVFNPKEPNDAYAENHEHSHAPDALRYWCISWNFPPERQSNFEQISDFDRFFKLKNETKGGYAGWEND